MSYFNFIASDYEMPDVDNIEIPMNILVYIFTKIEINNTIGL